MNTATKPPALKMGDTIAIITPSEPILDKKDLDHTIKYLERLGYKVKLGKNIGETIGDYVAGPANLRADDFNAAFADKEVNAVFVALGGMGASQILELINFDQIAKTPKIFAGYSDTTTLQLAILAKTGMVTFHGPNALSLPEFKMTGYTLPSFWRALTLNEKNLVIEPQSEWQGLISGQAEGILVGGNLSCFCKLLGTLWDPIATLPKIFGQEAKFLFFWEEANEHFSEVMRNLWQLRNSGFFGKVAGMIVGKLTDIAERDYQDFPHKKDLIREISRPFGFPVLWGVDFGHDVPRATIPIGVQAMMDTAAKKFKILETVVS